jgi:hypothetical protein
VRDALARFGAPLEDLSATDLASPDLVFQVGLPPARIDILTTISGVEFAAAWARRVTIAIGELQVPVLGREDFVRNKRAVGRPKDLADIALLEEQA